MAQAKQFLKFLLSLALRVLIAILVGTLLLTAVYLLPTQPMDDHLAISAATFAEEGSYPALFSWCSSQLDNFTDSIILMNAVYDSGASAPVQAMTGARGYIEDTVDPCQTLVSHYIDGRAYDSEEPYYQYWHGYLVLVKPLLLLTTYPGIRVINAIAQAALLAVLIVLLVKKGRKQYILPYITAILFLMPLAQAMSLQFSSCYYILLLGSIALLAAKDHLPEKEAFLFLYIGIATAYFDFLTYPIATLGIPAVLYCCLRERMEAKETLFRGVKLCFSWGVGYIGMWAGKWIIGSVITGQNVLAAASAKIAERSSTGAVQSGSLVKSIIDTLYANITTFLRTPATLILAVLAIAALAAVILAIGKHKPTAGVVASSLFPFVILACLPVIWYMATTNHSSIHYWFTCKGLAVSVFAGLCALVKLRDNIEPTHECNS